MSKLDHLNQIELAMAYSKFSTFLTFIKDYVVLEIVVN